MNWLRRGYLTRLFCMSSGDEVQADNRGHPPPPPIPTSSNNEDRLPNSTLELLTLQDISDTNTISLSEAVSRYLQLHRLNMALASDTDTFASFVAPSARLSMGLDILDGVMVCNGVRPAYVCKRISTLIEKYDPVASNGEPLRHLQFLCGFIMDILFDVFDGQPLSHLTEFKTALGQLSSELRRFCDELEHKNVQNDSGPPPNVGLLIEAVGRAIILFALVTISGQYHIAIPPSPSPSDAPSNIYIESPVLPSPPPRFTDTMNHTPCLEGTRPTLLAHFSEWLTGATAYRMHIVKGMPGQGKSTIAHTVAIRAQALGCLPVAQVFLTRPRPRDDSDSDLDPSNARKNPRPIDVFRSIAAQLYSQYVEFAWTHGEELFALFTAWDNINSEYHSMGGLARLLSDSARLVAPTTEGPRGRSPVVAIIVDALDECECAHSEEQEPSGGLSLLRGFVALVQALPFLRILVTTRPRPYLDTFVRTLPGLMASKTDLDDDWYSGDKYDVDNRKDIEVYLRWHLGGLVSHTPSRIHHAGLESEEEEEAVRALADMVGGVFFIAAAAVRFILNDNKSGSSKPEPDSELSQSESPSARMKTLLHPPTPAPRTSFQDDLDRFYTSIIERAVPPPNPQITQTQTPTPTKTSPISPDTFKLILGCLLIWATPHSVVPKLLHLLLPTSISEEVIQATLDRHLRDIIVSTNTKTTTTTVDDEGLGSGSGNGRTSASASGTGSRNTSESWRRSAKRARKKGRPATLAPYHPSFVDFITSRDRAGPNMVIERADIEPVLAGRRAEVLLNPPCDELIRLVISLI